MILFEQVNDLGDNLFIACARAGDECGDTLSELVRKEENDPPLFNIHHTNTNGKEIDRVRELNTSRII